MRLRYVLIVLSLLAFGIVASGCSDGGSKDKLTLAPESALPSFVRNAPGQVKEAYRFAIANPDVLTNYPCYCGCGNMAHMNNLNCYIKEFNPDGSIVFDNHAFG